MIHLFSHNVNRLPPAACAWALAIVLAITFMPGEGGAHEGHKHGKAPAASEAAPVSPDNAQAPTTEPSRDREAATTGPTFKPGIPGMKMVDVRDHKFLWREIAELQTWERYDRISVAEYRSKVIEKTIHFLELDEPAAAAFTTAASAAVATVRKTFRQRQPSAQDPSGAQGRFTADLRAATTRLQTFLQEAPRHQLFAPGVKKWILRLAFGPSEAKEAREAKAARKN